MYIPVLCTGTVYCSVPTSIYVHTCMCVLVLYTVVVLRVYMYIPVLCTGTVL